MVYKSELIEIDIDEDGTIKIASTDGDAAVRAMEWIKGIVAEPEVGVIYTGKVVRIMNFGAFVPTKAADAACAAGWQSAAILLYGRGRRAPAGRSARGTTAGGPKTPAARAAV